MRSFLRETSQARHWRHKLPHNLREEYYGNSLSNYYVKSRRTVSERPRNASGVGVRLQHGNFQWVGERYLAG